MLLAVLGITIGVLFIIISPLLDYEKVGVAEIKMKFNCSESEYQSILDQDALDIVDVAAMNYKLIENKPVQRYIKIDEQYMKEMYQIRVLNNTTKHYLQIFIEELASDNYKISIKGFGNGYEEIDAKYLSDFISEELKYWPRLHELSKR